MDAEKKHSRKRGKSRGKKHKSRSRGKEFFKKGFKLGRYKQKHNKVTGELTSAEKEKLKQSETLLVVHDDEDEEKSHSGRSTPPRSSVALHTEMSDLMPESPTAGSPLFAMDTPLSTPDNSPPQTPRQPRRNEHDTPNAGSQEPHTSSDELKEAGGDPTPTPSPDQNGGVAPTPSYVDSDDSVDSGDGEEPVEKTDNKATQDPPDSTTTDPPDATATDPPNSSTTDAQEEEEEQVEEFVFGDARPDRRTQHYNSIMEEMDNQRVLCDFMKKKSKKEMLSTHVWQKRLWALDKHKLTGYKRKNPQAVGVEVQLWKITRIVKYDKKHDGCRFDIVTGDSQTFSILTNSPETCHKWVETLTELVRPQVEEKFSFYL